MGKPAARLTDDHTCPLVSGTTPHVGGPIVAPCEPNVLIGGLPAARIGDQLICDGPTDVIVEGSNTVLIGGKPAARFGDKTAHGGVIIVGCDTVLIGDAADGSLDEQDDDASSEDADDNDASEAGDADAGADEDAGTDSAAQDGASGGSGEAVGGAQSVSSPEPSPALQGGVEETSTTPGEIGGDHAVTGSLSDGAPSSITLYGRAEDEAPPTGELGGDHGVAGSLTDAPSAEASLYGEVLPQSAPASSKTLYGGVQDTGAPASDGTPRLYGSVEETNPQPSSRLLKGEVQQNEGTPSASQSVFGQILTASQRTSQSVSGLIRASPRDDGPGGEPGVQGSSDHLTRTTTLTGRILGTQPPAPTTMMPDGLQIELRPATTQKELDDQRYSGFMQGFGNGMKNYGHDDAIDYLKHNLKDEDGWKGDKIADYASAVAKVLHEGTAKGLDKLSSGLGVYQDMSSAQGKLQKWVDFQNNYDQQVREGKLPYSPIVQNYTNGQMLAITIHAYKGFLGGIP